MALIVFSAWLTFNVVESFAIYNDSLNSADPDPYKARDMLHMSLGASFVPPTMFLLIYGITYGMWSLLMSHWTSITAQF